MQSDNEILQRNYQLMLQNTCPESTIDLIRPLCSRSENAQGAIFDAP